jgi:D-lactate dehydrogenase
VTFPNVLITGYQAFFTAEALTAIATATVANLTEFERTGKMRYEVSVEKLAAE